MSIQWFSLQCLPLQPLGSRIFFNLNTSYSLTRSLFDARRLAGWSLNLGSACTTLSVLFIDMFRCLLTTLSVVGLLPLRRQPLRWRRWRQIQLSTVRIGLIDCFFVVGVWRVPIGNKTLVNGGSPSSCLWWSCFVLCTTTSELLTPLPAKKTAVVVDII